MRKLWVLNAYNHWHIYYNNILMSIEEVNYTKFRHVFDFAEYLGVLSIGLICGFSKKDSGLEVVDLTSKKVSYKIRNSNSNIIYECFK